MGKVLRFARPIRFEDVLIGTTDSVYLDHVAAAHDLSRLSRSTVTNRDGSDLATIEARIAEDPAFLATLRALLDKYDPPQALSAPFSSSASRTGPASDSDSLVGSLLETLDTHRDQTLYWVTLTGPGDPRAHLGNVLASCPGAWGVVEARRDQSLHVHALVLLQGDEAAQELSALWCSLSGGSLVGQDHRRVSGWPAYAVKRDPSKLARNLSRIVRYAGKAPIASFAVGALADVPRPSRSAAMSAPTVTPACLCGCGQPHGPRSKYAGPKCAARQRQRESRANRKPVTATGDRPPTVTEGSPTR